MRLLTICGDLERGGIQRVAQNFARAYARAGHASAVLTYNGGGFRRAALTAAGVEVFVGGETGDGHDLPRALDAADAFAPDVIHIHRAGVANALEGALLRRLRTGHRRVIETNVFARVDYSPDIDLIDVHLQLSAWCMWRWRKWLGRSGRHRAGVVVPNAIAAADFARDEAAGQALRARLGIPADAYLCGRVGQANMPNWHEATLRAFAAVARHDPGAHLLLLGLPPQLEPAYAALPDDVRRRCHRLGLTNSDAELSAVYSAIDTFLHTASSGESFGLVLTEAMLCGCPVVTSSRPHKSNSQVEVVGNRVGGLVAGSADALPDAALAMATDPDLRRRIASGAREWVLSRFADDLVAARALRVAELALNATDRAALARALAAEPGLQTHTTDAQIRRLLDDTIGPPSRIELAKKRLVHVPALQRAIAFYLRRRYYGKVKGIGR